MYNTFAISLLIVSILTIGICLYLGKKGKVTTNGFILAIGRILDRYWFIFLALIYCAYFVTRLTKLQSFPNGFNVDELSMAADAKMIRYWGMDRNGVRMPAYFFNYGGGMNALSIYVNAILFFFAPTNLFTMRIMAVVWGALLVLAVFGICYELSESRGFALAGAVLVTILPVCVMSERWGLESYVLLPFCGYTMYFLVCAVKKEKIIWWILSGVFMGLSLYTYAISYVLWPIFLLLFLFYMIYLRKFKWKQWVAMCIPLAIIGLPVFLYQLVNEGFLEPFSFLFSDFFPLPISRDSDMGFRFIGENFLYLKQMFLGGEELTYNVLPEFGTIYMFLLPLMVIGFVMVIVYLVESIRKREYNAYVLFLFFFIGGFLFTMVMKHPNINRCNELFLPYMIFIFLAFLNIYRSRGYAIVLNCIMAGASFAFFMYFYFFVQNSVYGLHPLFTSSAPYRAVCQAEQYYVRDDDTLIYIQFDDYATDPSIQAYYFWGTEDQKWDEEEKAYGRVRLGFPEEFDENENAVYILDNEARGHIIGYLISIGYSCDQQFDGYSILFK